MQRKVNDRMLWICVVMIAVSLILQIFAVKSILNEQTPGKDYTEDGFVEADFLKYGQTSIPKDIYIAKFSQYKHVSEDGTTLNLFTNEQYEELTAMRTNGKRDPLTVDEILFIIEDSIEIYFTYDRVVFTGCVYYNYTNSVIGSVSDRYRTVIFPKNPENFKSFEQYYNHIVSQISDIIWFRLAVHDSGLMEFYDQKNENDHKFNINSSVNYQPFATVRYHYSMLVGSNLGIDDIYQEQLEMDFYTYWTSVRGKEISEVADPDGFSIQNPALTLSFESGEVVMWDTVHLDAVKLFPTSSLEARVRDHLGVEFEQVTN